MPITVRYPGDIPAMGRVAQFSGEGAYIANVLNPLKTADVNRSVQTQLSLLDLTEGARRANLQAQVSRSNLLNQLQQQQAQAQFNRQSQERMAIYQNAQQMQRLQAQGRLAAAQAQTQFGYREALGEQGFGFSQQLGEERFGFNQQLQTQQDQAYMDRTMAEIRQRERAAMIQSLDPQSQTQLRSVDFREQKAKEEQRKRPIYRPEEFQQILQGFEQERTELIQNATRQPTLPQLFEQEIQWVPEQQTSVPTPWIRDHNGQWRIPQGWKAPEIESGNVADFYSTSAGQKKILDLATKDWASQKDGTYNDQGLIAPGRSFPDVLNQYQRELGGGTVGPAQQSPPPVLGPAPAPAAVQPMGPAPAQTAPMSSGLSPQMQDLFRKISNPQENAALDVVLSFDLGRMEPIRKSDLVGADGTNLLKSRSPNVREAAQTYFDLANSFAGQPIPKEFTGEIQGALLISTLGYSKFPRADADIQVIPGGISYFHPDGTVRRRPRQSRQSQLPDNRTGLENGLYGPFVTGGGTSSAF